jgi:hypothetical protein
MKPIGIRAPARTNGTFLLIAQYLQLVIGLSPLAAGLWSAPSGIAFVVGAMLTPRIVTHLRPSHTTEAVRSANLRGLRTARTRTLDESEDARTRLGHAIDSPVWLADRCPSMDFLIGSNRRALKGRRFGQRQSITRCRGKRVFLAGLVLA